jgi:hypothetical protein
LDEERCCNGRIVAEVNDDIVELAVQLGEEASKGKGTFVVEPASLRVALEGMPKSPVVVSQQYLYASRGKVRSECTDEGDAHENIPDAVLA